jgi:hypothetical protein
MKAGEKPLGAPDTVIEPLMVPVPVGADCVTGDEARC